MTRREFPRKVRAAVFLRAGGCCEGCGARLKTGEGEVDRPGGFYGLF
jgi:5-methylcytosine-specific restriction protein A